MTEIEIAQAQLQEIARDLEAIKLRLLGVREILPPSPEEADRLLDVELSDRSTEIGSAIQCVLRDSLEPAIQDLRAAAEML